MSRTNKSIEITVNNVKHKVSNIPYVGFHIENKTSQNVYFTTKNKMITENGKLVKETEITHSGGRYKGNFEEPDYKLFTQTNIYKNQQ